MPKLFVAAAAALLADLASAHAGHGFHGPHWHAGDLAVPLVMLGCAGAAFWVWSRKE
jgi:hypothetical protein